MKKTGKLFDCVQMKLQIQEQIAREFKGMSDDNAHGIQKEQIKKNPILGPFLNKVHEQQKQHFQKAG